ncbi:sugar ABC transporter ATP-binding protein [Aquibaculum sediminis]|uniref:sugar ABC transporter ATP-binding protein n=1 Tax=Aquibaculum sediminis TaxID=3231907 RepID=UPI00345356E1
MTPDTAPPLIEVEQARLRFGAVKALDGATLHIRPGECVGLVGHNGAGKSTIVNVINGALTPDEGTLRADGAPVERYGIKAAHALGVRCVFQELSLCPNLTVIENTRIVHRELGSGRGLGWRGTARRIIERSLDGIFPGHGIDSRAAVGSLSIAQRQMAEIAMAFSDAGAPPRLVILDEPTSSLDATLAGQLLAQVRRFVDAGGSVIFISHILHEILSTSDRVVVMKDGHVVAERPAGGFTADSLFEAMGSVAKPENAAQARRDLSSAPVMLEQRGRGLPFRAHRGELVGLTGLSGHGQTEMLLELYRQRSGDWLPLRDPAVAFVAGDRRVNGIFHLWSILENFAVASLGDLTRRGLVNDSAVADKGDGWKRRIEIRTQDMNNPILSLSGGNQQKVLFARALATRAPVVLMDDPMRGVDVGTKREVYQILREEAAGERTFVWYSTETEEVCLCDRVYVFREGEIVAELVGEEINEANILAASFQGEAA